MKKRILAAAALLSSVALLSACSATSSPKAGSDQTIKLVAADYGTGPSNTSQKYWDSLATAFHKTHPTITVDVQTVAWTDFDTKIQTMVQNKQYPDVTEGDYFNEYAKQGILYPAKDVMSPSTLKNLLGVFNNLGTYNGTQYGMQFTTSAQTMFYNKKLFAEAGISKAPSTWAQVESDAKKIKALGKVGLGLPLGPEAVGGEAFMWFLGNGGEYETTGGKWVLNSPQNVATFKFLTKLTSEGLTQPSPATTNRTDVWQSFAQGDVGMVNDGQGALIPIIEQAGVLSSSDWGTAPLVGKSKSLNTTLGVADLTSAFKSTPAKEAAIKQFLDFTYSDANQLKFDKEYDLLPATTSGAKTLSKNATFGPFLKALPNARQMPSDPAWISIKGQLQNTIGTAVISNPQSVLDTLQALAVKSASGQ
jgi:multiple sugar transport system substrate-binding protein